MKNTIIRLLACLTTVNPMVGLCVADRCSICLVNCKYAKDKLEETAPQGFMGIM